MVTRNLLSATVIVGALGYFIDVYDLVLFSIVRRASLRGLGVPDSELLQVGVDLLNWQMGGMLIGGILWGMLGDRKGRVSVLFGSIFLYSVANVANGLVTSVPMYAALRFIAGVGLAGELGAAITLVSEVLPTELRGYGTGIVAGVGLTGAVAAGIVGDYFDWRTAYFVGGGLGFLLLVLRLRMLDSGIYREMDKEKVRRGDLRLLFANRERILRFLYCILIAIPVWHLVGIVVTFSPEITRALNATEPILAGHAILFTYVGISSGDLVSGCLSQWMRTRKGVLRIFLGALSVLMMVTLFSRGFSAAYFYTLCVLMGFATGYWAVFVTVAAEQFGTNLRATVTTSTPNFVRGSVVLLTTLFEWFKTPLGIVHSALAVGALFLALAFWALSQLEETFGRDLNFYER